MSAERGRRIHAVDGSGDWLRPGQGRRSPHVDGLFVKAEGAHEYKLTTENGSTWELHSKTLKLSPHTGHTVTVTGKVRTADLHEAKEKVKDEMKEHGMNKDATEHGHLNVTNLSMVSDSCKK